MGGGQSRGGEGRGGDGSQNLNRPDRRAHTHGRQSNPREKTTKHKETIEERVNLVCIVCSLAAVFVLLLVLFFSCLVISLLCCFPSFVFYGCCWFVVRVFLIRYCSFGS